MDKASVVRTEESLNDVLDDAAGASQAVCKGEGSRQEQGLQHRTDRAHRTRLHDRHGGGAGLFGPSETREPRRPLPRGLPVAGRRPLAEATRSYTETSTARPGSTTGTLSPDDTNRSRGSTDGRTRQDRRHRRQAEGPSVRPGEGQGSPLRELHGEGAADGPAARLPPQDQVGARLEPRPATVLRPRNLRVGRNGHQRREHAGLQGAREGPQATDHGSSRSGGCRSSRTSSSTWSRSSPATRPSSRG